MSRGREGPKAFLQDYRGVIQTAAYAAYDSRIREVLIQAGCWAHVRRKFYDAHPLDPTAAAARDVVERIGRLYQTERQARDPKLAAAGRQALRQQHSVAEVSALKERLQGIRAAVLPGSPLAKACDYALRIWALGRQNWLHIWRRKSRAKDRGDLERAGDLRTTGP